VRLNDRGPFHDNRLIDVSVTTAKLLGFYEQGIAKVQVDYIGPAKLEGSDYRKFATKLSDENMPAMAMLPDIKFREPIFIEYPKAVFD
jgi:rare lipoprotein A